jgi:hypothetical protein
MKRLMSVFDVLHNLINVLSNSMRFALPKSHLGGMSLQEVADLNLGGPMPESLFKTYCQVYL